MVAARVALLGCLAAARVSTRVLGGTRTGLVRAVLECGRVEVTGTHAELLAGSPAYRRLVLDQWRGLQELLPAGGVGRT